MAHAFESPTAVQIPVLPLRDVVVFPYMVVPLFVGRDKSVAALEAAFARPDNDILIVAQLNARTNDPVQEDLYDVACVGAVKNIMRLPDGTVKVLVEGRRRARIVRFVDGLQYLCADVVPYAADDQPEPTPGEAERLRQDVRAAFEAYLKVNRRIPPEILMSVTAIDDPSQLADTIAAHVGLKLSERQELLALAAPYARLQRLGELLAAESEQLAAETPGGKKSQPQQGKSQPGHGEGGEQSDEFKQELEELAKQIADKPLSAEARDKLERELKKLKMMNPMSAEAGVVRTYLEWVLALPWATHSDDKLDVVAARAVLDEDHYGLDKPKERIVEYLAVQQLRGEVGKGPVLCLVGPPGVGKTSLAKSVAKALGRKFVRISLGGVRDEAEIRGHRRTYVGALPGKIIAALKRAGTSNPVLLLDEIDKMSMDFRGDPAAALLEVLDPEQHHAFVDHYIDLDYDLSKVLFITTANNLPNIPWPLQDRLEILELGGYTEYDKLQIAQHYLVPRQLEETGLAKVADVTLATDAIETLIRCYTREAGVRSLERQIGSVCRKLGTRHLTTALTEGADTPRKTYAVDGALVKELLGPEKFKRNDAEEKDRVGVSNGLAVTATGGDLLLVEVALVPGKGKMTVTGKLGEVMKESVEAALTYVRSRAHMLGLNKEFASKIDLHVHFPEGAIPKDGPSAGIAIASALCSALTQIPVRHDVAMTGEITLRGRVLQIGGLKEKMIAAHRAGIRRIVVPRENERDLQEIPKQVTDALDIVFVDHADQVLQNVLRLDDPKAFLANPTALSRDDLGIHDPVEGVVTH
ncbi:MAG: endopeptidase La [Deltaproteobacteria bacterium]|nr:endopeptidase La [Deltaproteobacteria bacterium]